MENFKKRGIFAKIALLIAISGMSLFISCNKNEPVRVEVCPGLKLKSVYIYNEGNISTSKGGMNILKPGATTITTSDIEFGITTQYGCFWMGKLYFVSKKGKRLVVIDEKTHKELGAIEKMNDGRAFAGIDAKRGVVTTSKGAFIVDLEKFEIGEELEGTDKLQCGGVFVADKYIFIIHQTKGILVYDMNDNLKLVKNLGMASVGFALLKDGSLWAADKTELVRINLRTLSAERVRLPAGLAIASPWGAWNQGSLNAALNENSLYFINSTSMFGGGNTIYKYYPGDASSLEKPFATATAEGYSFYGSGIGVDPTSGNIIGTLIKGFGGDSNFNCIAEFDAKTGEEIRKIDFEGIYFPSGMIFITE